MIFITESGNSPRFLPDDNITELEELEAQLDA
jgi:hypothetical protein